MYIRLVKPEDEEKVVELIAHFRVDLKRLKGIHSVPNIDNAKEELREYIEAKYPIFVAEDYNKELLGYMVSRIDNDVVWAESLFVRSDVRRKGIASKLYEKVEELAEELGGDTVYNCVHPNNDRMIPFLTKRGYNVLNLIEIRKPRENENLTERIEIGKYKYDY